MVGGPLPGARLPVDMAGLAASGHCVAGQNQVNAQPGVTAKTRGAIIPPAESLFRLVELAKYIGQAQVQQPRQRLPLLRAAQDGVTPFLGVVNVLVCGSNVEVPQYNEVLMA